MEQAIFVISTCAARGHVGWSGPNGRTSNFDAVCFLCFFGIPLIPLRACHAFRFRRRWFEADHEWLPLTWTLGLVLTAWLRRMALVLALYAVPLSLFAGLAIVERGDPDGEVLLALCVGAWLLFPVVWGGFWLLDARNRAIRTVMGNWRWGSADPRTIRRSWLLDTDLATPKRHYNRGTWVEAAEMCLRNHNWWGGMFAALMVERFEDPAHGRELVARILNDPEVRAGLDEVRKDDRRWDALLGPGRYERRPAD